MTRLHVFLAGLGLALMTACAQDPSPNVGSADPRAARDPQGRTPLRALGDTEIADALGFASLEMDEHRAIGVQRMLRALRASLAARGIDSSALDALDDRFVASTPPLRAFDVPLATSGGVGQQRQALGEGEDALRKYYDCPILAPDDGDRSCMDLIQPASLDVEAALAAQQAEAADTTPEDPEPAIDEENPESDLADAADAEEDPETGEDAPGTEDATQLTDQLYEDRDELFAGADGAEPGHFIRAWSIVAERDGATLAALYAAEALRAALACDNRPTAKAVAHALGREQGVRLVLELRSWAVEQVRAGAVNTDLIAEQLRGLARDKIATYMDQHRVCVDADLSQANLELQRAEVWRKEGLLQGIAAQITVLKEELRQLRRELQSSGAPTGGSASASSCDLGATCTLVSPDALSAVLPKWDLVLGVCVCCRQRRATGRLACKGAGDSPVYCGQGADGQLFCQRQELTFDGAGASGGTLGPDDDGVELADPNALPPGGPLELPLPTSEDIGEPAPLAKCQSNTQQWWRGARSRDVTFVSFGDAHAVDPSPGCPRNKKAAADQNQLLRAAINSVGDDPHVWPDGRGFLREGKTFERVRGVIVAGDLTQAGRAAGLPGAESCRELPAFRETFGRCGDEGKLRFPVYEGYGNHDFPFMPGGSDGATHPTVRFLDAITSANRPGAPAELFDDPRGGTGHYAWRWDDIWFVHLNLKAGYRNEVIPTGSGARTRTAAPHNSRRFLIDFLTTLPKNRRRQIAIVTHYPPNTSRIKPKERKAFCKVLDDARRGRGLFRGQGQKLAKANPVVALIHGHTHHAAEHYKWRCPSPYREITIPTFDSGTAFYQNKRNGPGQLHFTIFRLGRTRLEAVGVSAPAANPTGRWTYTHKTRLRTLLAPR